MKTSQMKNLVSISVFKKYRHFSSTWLVQTSHIIKVQ